jgi:hypothetical protein
LTFVSLAGAGWTIAGNVATRSDVLLPGASYPPLTVTVNVAANAPSALNNIASISGGGCGQTNNAEDATNIVASGGGGGIVSVASPVIGAPFTTDTLMTLLTGTNFPLPIAGPVLVLLPLIYGQITNPTVEPIPAVQTITDSTGATWTTLQAPINWLSHNPGPGVGFNTYQLYSAFLPGGIPLGWQVSIQLAGPSFIGFDPHTRLMAFANCTGVETTAFQLLGQPGPVTGASITTSGPRVIVTITSASGTPSGTFIYCQSGGDPGLAVAIYSSSFFAPNSSTMESVDLQPAGTYNPAWPIQDTTGQAVLSTVAVIPA